MTLNYIDFSAEVCKLQEPAVDRLVWIAENIDSHDYQVTITDEALTEIEQVVEFCRQNPLPILQRKLIEFELPAAHL